MHIKGLNRVCLAAVVLIALMLVACSPVYQTQYQYIPPEDMRDRPCLNTCLSLKQTCRAEKDREHAECKARASDAYVTCMSMRTYAYSYGPRGDYYEKRCVSNCYCNREFCSGPFYEECEDLYAECYRNCGGEVIPTQVCVRFCK